MIATPLATYRFDKKLVKYFDSTYFVASLLLGKMLPLGNKKIHFVQVSCGTRHTACVDIRGMAHTFGLNNFAQLGNVNLGKSAIPCKVIGDHAFMQVCASYNSTFGISRKSKRLQKMSLYSCHEKYFFANNFIIEAFICFLEINEISAIG